MNIIRLYICFVLLFAATHKVVAQRTHGGFYDAEKINNIQRNVVRFDWAAKIKNKAIEQAAAWIEKSDEELWHMVPGQTLPRTIDVTLNRLLPNPEVLGCIVCGDKIFEYGNYPYLVDIEKKPWKITCPSCHTDFPSNDFGTYYRSGIDERGLFDRSKADTSLLYKGTSAGTNTSSDIYIVDNGYGYLSDSGKTYRYIGYYVWKLWGHIEEGVTVLADAWLYTGDTIYARKAAILLDRIADVYPLMDWKPYAEMGWYHSDGGSMEGKIGGSIWETTLTANLATAYDKILSGTTSDTALFKFLQKMATTYTIPKKGSRADFVNNVDNGLLREILQAVLDEKIRGNQGMHQLSVAAAAIALHNPVETNKWLNWLFEPDGGALPGLLVNRFDRDGTSDEGAPGYAMLFGRFLVKLAGFISEYKHYTERDVFREFPHIKGCFTVACKMAVSGKAIPNQGDHGATGLVSTSLCDPAFAALGYYYYKDETIAAQAYTANNNSAAGLYGPIHSQDPEELLKSIEAIGKGFSYKDKATGLLTGYGYAILENGKGVNKLSVVSNYGRSIYHAHPDQLNFDIFAFDNWLTPDHGYPEYATRWPSNLEWTGTTLSHNIALVNQQPQETNWAGKTILYKQLPGLGIFAAEAPTAYPQTDLYRRTLITAGGNGPDSNVYVIDIFDLVGGDDHLLSFHGPPGTHDLIGLKLSPPEKGTYAGVNIPKGQWAKGFPIGFSHLYDVRRQALPPNKFTIDWKIDSNYRSTGKHNDLHLRFHSLSAVDDIALAKGDPPQNKPGNPKSLDYVLLHRKGNSLKTRYVSVIEPYQSVPFIVNIERKELYDGELLWLKVTKVNGFIDNFYISYQPTRRLQISDNSWMNADFLYTSERDNRTVSKVVINGSFIQNKQSLSGSRIKGKVVDMSKELQGKAWVMINTGSEISDSIAGDYIMISNSENRDATYKIVKTEKQGALTRVYVDAPHFVKGFKGGTMRVRRSVVPARYDQGYEYEFNIGDNFQISQSATYYSDQHQ